MAVWSISMKVRLDLEHATSGSAVRHTADWATEPAMHAIMEIISKYYGFFFFLILLFL